MVRRLSALHPEDTLTFEIIEAELADAAPPPNADAGAAPKELSETIERYLAGHFASYGRELPPPGLYDRMANLARHLKLEPETVLRQANAKFVRRFAQVERKLAAVTAHKGNPHPPCRLSDAPSIAVGLTDFGPSSYFLPSMLVRGLMTSGRAR